MMAKILEPETKFRRRSGRCGEIPRTDVNVVDAGARGTPTGCT